MRHPDSDLETCRDRCREVRKQRDAYRQLAMDAVEQVSKMEHAAARSMLEDDDLDVDALFHITQILRNRLAELEGGGK